MPSTDSHHSLRSETVQEILERPPKAIVRWGISLVFLILTGMVAGSCFIRYPDVLRAPIVITTQNLPAIVMARSTGKIDTLFVQEKQKVEEGQLLAIMESTTDWQDVLWLKEHIGDSLPSVLNLGELQASYTDLYKARNEYHNFSRTNYHARKIRLIRQQIENGQSVLHSLRAQLKDQNAQLETSRNFFLLDSGLYIKGLISKLEYENEKNKFFQQKQACQECAILIRNQEIELLQWKQNILELEQDLLQQNNLLTMNISGAEDALRAGIADWEQKYILKAPQKGIVALTTYWQKNQNVNVGEALITIVPIEHKHIVGKIQLSPQGAGKVKIGQNVNVKLDHFPFLEYGALKTVIRDISLVPTADREGKNVYLLEVAFPNPLITTCNKRLKFTQEMSGTAEIITDDIRLIDRFLRPVRAVLTQ